MRRSCQSFVLPALCALALLLAACAADDSGGSTGDADRVDTGRDLGDDASGLDVGDAADDPSESDSSDVSDDQGTPDQVLPDLVPDSDDDGGGQPDLIEPACGALNEPCCEGACEGELACELDVCVAEAVVCAGEPACLEPIGGEPDVPVVQRPGTPSALAGGTIVDGDYELALIELYTDGTVSDLVETFEVTSNGDTSGSLVFEATDWGFEANLDLFVDAVALDQNFSQTVAQALAAGGCFSAVGNELRGDLIQCGASWPEGIEPPESLDYEITEGGIQLLLIITREMILAAVPEDDRLLVGLAVSGDLPVLLTFSALE